MAAIGASMQASRMGSVRLPSSTATRAVRLAPAPAARLARGVRAGGRPSHLVCMAVGDARSLTYTHYEGNTFALDFPNGVKALVDPWLVGDLTFFGTGALFTGRKMETEPGMEVSEGTDVIILTQYLEDHTHLPTLRKMDKNITVIACPEAAKIARELGFKNVVSLDHGEGARVASSQLSVRATEGALIGPPWSKKQNGFVLREEAQDGVSVYFEPHVDYGVASVKREAPVDVVITPIEGIAIAPAAFLPGFPLVKGGKAPIELTRTLQPRVVVPLPNGEIQDRGAIAPGIQREGVTPEGFRESLRASGILSVEVADPPAPGIPLSIALPVEARYQ